MKKIILLSALIALCCSCDKSKDNGKLNVACDPAVFPYCFYIENETDREIMLRSDAESVELITIAAGNSTLVCEMYGFSYDCFGPVGMPWDHFERAELQVVELYPTNYYPHPYSMTIGSEAVPKAIWARKNWTFETPDPYTANYTMTVTDELLASLGSE